MIDFMLIAAPRCGTTWAANWLSTDRTICLHDPLYERHYTELDEYKTDKIFGISCTGIGFFADWVNAHPARKVVLHRDLNEINASLDLLGLQRVTPRLEALLCSIRAVHLPWTDLFDDPKPIYEYLLGLPFDAERHKLLAEIEMQPKFESLPVNRSAVAKLVSEVKASMNARN